MSSIKNIAHLHRIIWQNFSDIACEQKWASRLTGYHAQEVHGLNFYHEPPPPPPIPPPEKPPPPENTLPPLPPPEGTGGIEILC